MIKTLKDALEDKSAEIERLKNVEKDEREEENSVLQIADGV